MGMIQMQNGKRILCTWCEKYAVRVIEETELSGPNVRVTLTQYACVDHKDRSSTAVPNSPAIQDMAIGDLEKATLLYIRSVLPSGLVPDNMRVHSAMDMIADGIRRRQKAHERRVAKSFEPVKPKRAVKKKTTS